MRFEGVEFISLDSEQAASLIEKFFKEEVKQAIGDCKGNKSHKFDFNYIKSYWDSLKVDVLCLVNDFNSNGVIPRGGNAMLLQDFSKDFD